MKKIKIIITNRLRKFLGIERDCRRIEADLQAIMKKELDRDQQYPLDDLEALPPELPSYPAGISITPGDQQPGWYVIGKFGFAGPFEKEKHARDYALGAPDDCEVKKLYRHGVIMSVNEKRKQ